MKGELVIRRMDFFGGCAGKWTVSGGCGPDEAAELWRRELDEKEASDGTFFYHGRFTPDDLSAPLETVFFPGPPKSRDIQKCRIHGSLKIEKDQARLTLSTDRPAFYLFLEHQDRSLAWSDNLFHLLPEEPVTVTVPWPRNGDAEAFIGGLEVHALRNYSPQWEIHIDR